jgi:hypothetical protein
MTSNDSNITTCKPVINKMITKLEERFYDFFNVMPGNGEYAAMAALLHPKFKKCWIKCLDDVAQEKIKKLIEKLIPTREEQSAEQLMVDEFFFFGDDPVHARSNTHGNDENELTKYLEQKSTSFELFKEFPGVTQLFIKYNTALPSSAPVERLFSHATLLDLPKYNRLTDKNFEMRVLCKVNKSGKYS